MSIILNADFCILPRKAEIVSVKPHSIYLYSLPYSMIDPRMSRTMSTTPQQYKSNRLSGSNNNYNGLFHAPAIRHLLFRPSVSFALSVVKTKFHRAL